MAYTQQTIVAYGLAETGVLLNTAFAEYTVPIHFDDEGFARILVSAHVDVTASRVLLEDGEAIGVALIAKRGFRCRLAAMAIVPAARSRGAGTWFLHELCRAARESGQRSMELEVISSNHAGVALYHGAGFQFMRRLLSFQLPTAAVHGAAADVREIDIRAYARTAVTHGLRDLPWQISGESAAQFSPPHRAFALDGAQILISNPEAAQIAIQGLVVPAEMRGSGRARRLVAGMIARFPEKAWRVPALCPEEFAGFWQKLGFDVGRLSQFQMELDFGIQGTKGNTEQRRETQGGEIKDRGGRS